MKTLSNAVIFVSCCLLAACGERGSSPEPEAALPESSNATAEQAALQIDGEYMRGIVKEISDDKYEGRGPGTRGDDVSISPNKCKHWDYNRARPTVAGTSRSIWLASTRRNRSRGRLTVTVHR